MYQLHNHEFLVLINNIKKNNNKLLKAIEGSHMHMKATCIMFNKN